MTVGSTRVTRQSSRQSTRPLQNTFSSSFSSDQIHGNIHCAIESLPITLTSSRTGLSKRDLVILRMKQQWLLTHQIATSESTPAERTAVNATLVFAQEEAGTAVCISSTGLILTCSHCVAENKEELRARTSQYLLFASGLVVQTKCVAWDPQRDLALLQIIGSQRETTSFPTASIAANPPRLHSNLACIGHPGSEDLETSIAGTKTNYDVLHLSTGKFRGYVKGQDLQDNSDIGALKHDCWTYWGHSGAPLFDSASGELVGIHSSWDDSTGMRRGIPLEAIQRFIRQYQAL